MLLITQEKKCILCLIILKTIVNAISKFQKMLLPISWEVRNRKRVWPTTHEGGCGERREEEDAKRRGELERGLSCNERGKERRRNEGERAQVKQPSLNTCSGTRTHKCAHTRMHGHTHIHTHLHNQNERMRHRETKHFKRLRERLPDICTMRLRHALR